MPRHALLAPVVLFVAVRAVAGQPTAAAPAQPPASPAPAAAPLTIGGAPAEAPLQHTRLVVFSIPFDPPPPSLRALEVQLYFSPDHGRSWSLYGKAAPTAGQFTFRAPRDGEYWFFVRTLDDRGTLHPAKIGEPEMRVVVDTVPPKLELKIQRGPSGELVGSWRIEDPLLKPDGLKLTCGAGAPGPTWQTLATGPLKLEPGGTAGQGESTWWVQAIGPELVVRAEAVDLAGNTLVVQEQVAASASLAATATAPPAPAAAAPPAPARPWAPDGLASNGPQSAAAPPVEAPAAPSVAAPVASAVASAVAPPVAQQQPAPSAAALEAGAPASMPTAAQPPADAIVEERPFTLADIPAGVVPRFVNSRRFELHCDLAPAVGEGIRAIELWGTRDGGAHWISFGQSTDVRGPLVMTVNGEGVYGFRIRLHAPSGAAGAAPQPGDAPDIWVVVDTTPPQARLTRVDFGAGAQSDQVSIGWEADDARLAGRPVSLDYASQPAGPWTAIATGLPNSGVHVWRPDARLPARALLRLSVKDEAGNATSVQTPEPVALPRPTTTARIIDARALAR